MITETNISVLGEASTDILDNITITADTIYSVSVIRSRKKICLSLYHNASNGCVSANGVKIYPCKAKGSEVDMLFIVFGRYLKDFYS